MRLICNLLAAFVLFLFTGRQSSAQPQQPVFDFSAAVGLNFSELEGDGQFDYFGLNAGLLSTARLGKHWRFGMELLYSQNGEYILPEYYPPVDYGPIRLHHIEVPVFAQFSFGILQRKRFYDLHFQAGLAYAYLFRYQAFDRGRESVTNQIRLNVPYNYLAQLGASYQFSPKSRFNFRASLPLTVGLDWTLSFRYIRQFNL